MTEHWFWLLLAAACVVWYSSVTIYVAVKGLRDIRTMLSSIAAGSRPQQKTQHPETAGR